MSAAAEKVLAAFGAFMLEIANTDPTEWEPDEVCQFADGIEQVNTVMQIAKVHALQDVSDAG